VQLGTTQAKLKILGVETLAVVNTPQERARLYFKYRPIRVLLAADPAAATHQAFRLRPFAFVEDERIASWPESVTMGQLEALRLNPTGELPTPMNPFEGNAALNEKDGFEMVEADQEIMAAHMTLGTGHFLVDRQGIVRWRQVEAMHGLADLLKFPSDEEILDAARAL